MRFSGFLQSCAIATVVFASAATAQTSTKLTDDYLGLVYAIYPKAH
jgi:hypothetical protein